MHLKMSRRCDASTPKVSESQGNRHGRHGPEAGMMQNLCCGWFMDKYLCISTPVSRPSIFAGAVGFYTGEFMVEYLSHMGGRDTGTIETLA